MVIGDVGEPLLGRPERALVDHHHVLTVEVVEDRRQLAFEQRQPVLHTRQPPPVADRLVEWVLRRVGAEQLAVVGTEALDALIVEQRLGGRQEQVTVDPLDRQLRGRVEEAQALKLVAEEVEPQPAIERGGEDVDDRAAHRELAVVDHRVCAAVALPGEQRGKAPMPDLHAHLELAHGLAHAERGEHALEHGVDGGHQQLLRGSGLLKSVERGKPLGADRQRGTCTVVWQAVPRGEGDHLDLGREEARGLGGGAHRGIVGRDVHRPAFCGAREIGQHQRQAPARQRG